jgi:hypothetical protein
VHARPDVVQLEPWQGPVRGGSLVVVSGVDLPPTLTTRCFFGSVATLPRLMSRTRFECVSPAMTTPRTVQASSGT